MASTTRGSIKLSTANGIGAALVDKLGGAGYSPSEWKDNINLCGIHAADIETALANIEESAGTGEERGSILLSTANAIGTMLNKKFDTSRGFKPKEWASAISKLEPLPERTASGSIAHIEDGASEVPVKNWLVTLPASLSGYSSIVGTKSGKNLIDLSSLVDGYVNSNGTFNTNHSKGEMRSEFIPVKPDTTYYFSIVETTGTEDAWVGIGEYTSNDGTGFIRRDSFWRFTTSSTAKYVVVSARNLAQATKIQLEIGNDQTTWEAYTPITQYTATLGRTIYGGQADIVNGVGKETYARVKISDLTWSVQTVSGRSAFVSGQVTGLPTTSPKNVLCDVLTYDGEKTIGAMTNKTLVTWTNTFRIYDTDCADVTEFLSTYGNGYIVYQLKDSAQTDFTFTPITPTPETENVCNFWADEGDSEVVYRADIDSPEPEEASLLGAINDEEE